MKTKKRTTHRPAPALPPIPRDTLEGARAHGIAAAIRALRTPTQSRHFGLELQPEEFEALGEALNVPALFLSSTYFRESEGAERPEQIEAYVAWRMRLAGKAVR